MKKYNVCYKIKGVGEGITCVEADNDIEAQNIFLDEYCQEWGYSLDDVEVQQITRAYSRRSEDDD